VADRLELQAVSDGARDRYSEIVERTLRQSDLLAGPTDGAFWPLAPCAPEAQDEAVADVDDRGPLRLPDRPYGKPVLRLTAWALAFVLAFAGALGIGIGVHGADGWMAFVVLVVVAIVAARRLITAALEWWLSESDFWARVWASLGARPTRRL
jgi:hypothetical protein